MINDHEFRQLMQLTAQQKSGVLAESLQDLTPHQWMQFSEILGNNTTLKELNLWGNKLDSFAAEHIADALRKNTTVEKLALGINELEDAGVKVIAQMLQHNNTLTFLDIGEKSGQMVQSILV